MSRPRKDDALSPAERARRYRARRTVCHSVAVTKTRMFAVTETHIASVTETRNPAVTKTHTQSVTEIRMSAVTGAISEIDWPFPGTSLWFERHGYVRAHPDERRFF